MEIKNISYMDMQYIKMKETQMGSDLNINKCNLTKYIWVRYKNACPNACPECMSRKLNKFSL